MLWNLQRAIRQQRKILTVQVKRRNLHKNEQNSHVHSIFSNGLP